MACPQQQDAHNCGIFVLAMLNYLTHGLEFDFEAKDVPFMRRALCWELISHCIRGMAFTTTFYTEFHITYSFTVPAFYEKIGGYTELEVCLSIPLELNIKPFSRCGQICLPAQQFWRYQPMHNPQSTHNSQFPTAYLPTADCRLPTTDYRLLTADCCLPTADCQLPFADCCLPTANGLLTPNCLYLSCSFCL